MIHWVPDLHLTDLPLVSIYVYIHITHGNANEHKHSHKHTTHVCAHAYTCKVYTLLFLYSADVDYDSDVIDVVFNVGDDRVTVAINITDDNNDEGNEAFGLDLKRTDGTPNTVQISGLTTAFGIIDDNDEPGK